MELLILGTAHFESTGDYVQLSEEQKGSLQDEQFQKLVETLTPYKPTQIFTEDLVENEEELNKAYVTDEVSDSFKRNEIYRIAFALGRKLQLPTIHAVDWNKFDGSVPSFDKMFEGPDADVIKEILDKYTSMDIMKDDLLKEDLIKYIRQLNSEAFIKVSHDIYVELMEVSDDAFEWVTRYWYYRNLKIVQNIKRAWHKDTERAVLLIGGSHTYLVRQALLEDERFTVITYDEWMNR
jgi:hypothetical protein